MQKMTCPCDVQPAQGDCYVCDTCKMTVVVIKSCSCADANCVSLCCCGQAMTKAN